MGLGLALPPACDEAAAPALMREVSGDDAVHVSGNPHQAETATACPKGAERCAGTAFVVLCALQ